MFRLNPETIKKIRRFKQIKRGYYSFLFLVFLSFLFLIGELLINSRALIVKYEGELYFPTYGAFHPGTDFGLPYNYETNYRELKQKFADENSDNWVLLPPVPYNPYENHSTVGIYRPEAPNADTRHFLGTDTTSRDILARLFYGTRTALLFSVAFLICVYAIGVAIGAAMGYLGGWFDLMFQRVIEIWSNIPFLYMVIIIFSVIPATFSISATLLM